MGVDKLSYEDTQKAINESYTEAQFQAMVENLASMQGWLYNHNYDSRKSTKGGGLPDLIMVREGRVIFAELKRQKGKTTERQQLWLWSLSVCDGVESYLWRPSDWNDIQEILK